MKYIQFSDGPVTYQEFVDDVAARVAHFITQNQADPEYISQRQAYRIFGRRNVERWRRLGKVQPCKRLQKLEYPTAQLRLLQRTQQDYLLR